MKKIVNILALLLITNNLAFGQSNRAVTAISKINTIEETVYLHCNTTTFLSGETLFLKFYSLNPNQKKFSTVSKIGYVELLDAANKSVLKQKIVLKNGTGQGDFFITTALKTGMYKLVAYTHWTLNKFDNGIYKTDIFIINPFESNTLDENIQNKRMEVRPSDGFYSNKTTKPSNTAITLKTNKNKYTTREKVSLTIQSNADEIINGNFSVSVRKTDSLPTPTPINSLDFLNLTLQKNNSIRKENRFIPEFRGEIISGKISAKENTNELKEKTVALSIPGKNFAFKLARTDEKGNFNFILDEHPSASNAIVQVMEKDRNEYSITLNETPQSNFGTLSYSEQLHLEPKDKRAIENRSVANQIENNYYKSKKDSLLGIPKTAPFFYPLQKEYILDDYTRFPTLKETIIEILNDVYYKKEKDIYSIHIKDYTTEGEAYGEALVMVDGLLIQNINELFEYDMQNVYKVSFVNQGYVYGPKVFNGIINFVTKKNDFETKTYGDFIKPVTLERPQPTKKYFNPDYSGSDLERIPDFRYQLVWAPDVTLAEKEIPLHFYTSDIKGEYQISIEGFTGKGNAVSIKEYITVE